MIYDEMTVVLEALLDLCEEVGYDTLLIDHLDRVISTVRTSMPDSWQWFLYIVKDYLINEMAFIFEDETWDTTAQGIYRIDDTTIGHLTNDLYKVPSQLYQLHQQEEGEKA